MKKERSGERVGRGQRWGWCVGKKWSGEESGEKTVREETELRSRAKARRGMDGKGRDIQSKGISEIVKRGSERVNKQSGNEKRGDWRKK